MKPNTGLKQTGTNAKIFYGFGVRKAAAALLLPADLQADFDGVVEGVVNGAGAGGALQGEFLFVGVAFGRHLHLYADFGYATGRIGAHNLFCGSLRTLDVNILPAGKNAHGGEYAVA